MGARQGKIGNGGGQRHSSSGQQADAEARERGAGDVQVKRIRVPLIISRGTESKKSFSRTPESCAYPITAPISTTQSRIPSMDPQSWHLRRSAKSTKFRKLSNGGLRPLSTVESWRISSRRARVAAPLLRARMGCVLS